MIGRRKRQLISLSLYVFSLPPEAGGGGDPGSVLSFPFPPFFRNGEIE